jgi:hypothetical protein
MHIDHHVCCPVPPVILGVYRILSSETFNSEATSWRPARQPRYGTNKRFMHTYASRYQKLQRRLQPQGRLMSHLGSQ